MNSTKEKVGVCIVGCGGIATKRYFPEISRNLELVNLVALCDVDEKKNTESKMALGELGVSDIKKTYTRYEDTLDDSEINAVLILSPHMLHAEQSIAALKAGKHVLVEKPMATNIEDADRMVKAAEKSKAKLMALPYMMAAITPNEIKAKELLAEEVIGKVCFARSRSSWPGPYGLGVPSWFLQKEKAGVGALFDAGVYSITSLSYMLGPAKAVSASVDTAVSEWEARKETFSDELEKVKVTVDDIAIVLLNWGRGTIGVVESGWWQFSLPKQKGEVKSIKDEIHGTEGAMYLGHNLGSLIVCSLHPDAEKIFRDKEKLIGNDGQAYPNWYKPPLSPVEDAVHHFAECILKDRKPIPSGELGRYVVEVMAKAYVSSETGKTINLKFSF